MIRILQTLGFCLVWVVGFFFCVAGSKYDPFRNNSEDPLSQVRAPVQSAVGVNSQEKAVFGCGSNVFAFRHNAAVHHINESVLLAAMTLMECAVQTKYYFKSV